jgi:hypothetical protein
MSAVLEVILSALDRDLIPTNPSAAALAATCQQQGSSGNNSSSSSSSSVPAAELLAAVGRYPAGYAPAAASDGELMEAFKVLQVNNACCFHLQQSSKRTCSGSMGSAMMRCSSGVGSVAVGCCTAGPSRLEQQEFKTQCNEMQYKA